MPATAPMLSRLRRRSFGAAWLCVLLIVMKVGLATGCMGTDAPSTPTAVAAQAVLADDAQQIAAKDIPSLVDADCWHADPGDCHCSCMHAVPLTSNADVRVAMRTAASPFVAAIPRLNSPPAQDELRPPIA